MSGNSMKHVSEYQYYVTTLRKQARILDLISDALILCDFDNKITYWNRTAERQYGWVAEEAIGRHLDELLKTNSPIPVDKIVALLIQEGLWEGEVVQTHRNGSQLIVWSHCALLKDEKERITGILQINRDMTEQKQKEEQIRNLSMTDELTGIYNRRGFLAFSQQQLKIANRMKKGTNLFFADMDGLKWINDNFGHQEGDRAIIDVANIFKNTFRESDIVARMGGDEFAVIGIEAIHVDAEVLAARLQENIERRNKENTRPYKLSISVGVVRYNPENPCSVEELLDQADKLMYEQKRNKKERMKMEEGRR